MNEKEEVKKAVLELKMFGLDTCQQEVESVESQEDIQPQVTNFRQSLYQQFD